MINRLIPCGCVILSFKVKGATGIAKKLNLKYQMAPKFRMKVRIRIRIRVEGKVKVIMSVKLESKVRIRIRLRVKLKYE